MELKHSPPKSASGTLDALLARHAPGDRLTVHAFRRDELASFELVLDRAPEDTCYLAFAPETPPEAVARRDAWLDATAGPRG